MNSLKYAAPLAQAILLVATTTAWGSLSYDQNVNTPGPGVYYGTGNGNGAWTVDRENNIELGLRGKVYGQGVYNSGGDGTYSFATGVSPLNLNRDTWNFDFSINVDANGTSGLHLSDFTFTLAVDSNPSLGQSFTDYNPLAIYNDDELALSGQAAPSVKVYNGNNSTLANYDVAQNSENAKFGLPLSYDPNIAGTYDFVLSAFDKTTGTLEAQTSMRILVGGGAVPEVETTCALLALGCAALGGLRRFAR